MLSNKHFTALIINVLFVKVLLTFPKTVVLNSGNAAWIQVLYNLITALLFFTALMKLYNKKKNIIQIAQINGGKTLKIIAGIITFILLSVNLVPVIRIFPESVNTILLRETNTEIVIILTALAGALGAYIGIDSIGRINRLFLPAAAVVFAAFILMLIPNYRIENITPIFGTGAGKIFLNGFNSLSLFSDLLILNLLIPFAQNLDSVRKYGRYAIITAGGLAVVTTAAYCLTYSYPASKDFIIPVYQMARLVNLSSFFGRFEALFEFIWSIMILLYISLYLYMMCYTLQITFSLKYLRPLILPVTIIIFIISLIPQSLMDTIEISDKIGCFSYIQVFALMLIFSRARKIK